ncbi:hypothetical protein BD311DRAFT_266257 [Dichomitus squalens]|uniref:Protein kinase domain-containing protein n=1 Tax=Dichomitus squalens TaxID=114155 RepID=A0A4V2K0N5_9APHY|nr:hypothetical protein BD311DRAFT_266257 [Dichomitus squalens]
MLQYPVQLPPLSLSSSKRPPAGRDRDHDDRRNGHLRLAKLAPHDPRIVAHRPPTLPVTPISIPSALSPASSASASTYPSPLPSPVSHPAKLIHRSSFTSSPRQLPSPVARSPHPLRSNLPSFDGRSISSGHSSVSSSTVDVLSQGDLVGEGLSLQGETITRVPISSSEPRVDHDEPAKEFEVVRKLGTGSYAVVYLVREVLSRPQSSDDGHVAAFGRMDLDDGSYGNQSTEYGREYAIKVLSKANLDEDALTAQLFEATIHQSLPAHPNIVTLHRTLETPSFLLLLLEFVPGEDLFYFLEQARDHYEIDPSTTDTSTSPNSDSSCLSQTPPTPSLLSSLAPSQLLSRTRLRLIASMFSQMCDAVATCHEHSVFHRDIKPENFIVTDGWIKHPDGRSERKVVVKLTDFGLSTTDIESADMDCGSAPYMSFECRNNIHPTYSPRAADVWSLGIVLINMLYHYNPWTDTTQGVCSSFELYCQQPVNFFMQRFSGMTLPVAEFLANNVFCLLDDHKDDSKRISARAFGIWIKDLPNLLGGPSIRGHTRNISIASVQGHRLSSIPHSRRPSVRNSIVAGEGMSRRTSRNLSRAPSLGPAFEHKHESPITLPPVPDGETEQENAMDFLHDHHDQHDHDAEAEVEGESGSRSTSTHKRRKRGARKGKGTTATSPTSPSSAHDVTLETLAQASQALAREISRTSRHSATTPVSATSDVRPVPYPISPGMALPPIALLNASVPPSLTSLGSSTPSISKKSSKWKLSFGKNSANAAAGAKSFAAEDGPSTPEVPGAGGKQMSATASNVTNLLMSLNAPPVPSAASPHTPAPHPAERDRERDFGSFGEYDDTGSWNRGRRPKNGPYAASPNASSTWGPSSGSPFRSSQARGSPERRYGGPIGNTGDKRSERGISPSSTRSGRPLASSASSMASSNWRSSMSSAGTSTSAFTRYSNNSTRSVSTAATSVSSQSWRSQGSKVSQDPAHAQMPANVKFVTGTPWELYQLPRQMYPNPDDAKFGGPPQRKRRANKPKDLTLDTITERPPHPKSPLGLGQRQDAATSTTDLGGDGGNRDREGGDSHDGTPRKVQKGQINALAKMLSALRR